MPTAPLSDLVQQHSPPVPCDEEEGADEEVQVNNRVAGGAGKRLSVEDLQVCCCLKSFPAAASKVFPLLPPRFSHCSEPCRQSGWHHLVVMQFLFGRRDAAHNLHLSLHKDILLRQHLQEQSACMSLTTDDAVLVCSGIAGGCTNPVHNLCISLQDTLSAVALTGKSACMSLTIGDAV